MEPLPKIGKVDRRVFEEVILPHLGRRDPSVIVGPKFGVDFSVIEVGDRVLIVEVDPVFVVPEYGWERSAWFSLHILASDVAVSGVPPRYLFIDLNLPLKMSDEEFSTFWRLFHREAEKLGVAIAAGHTGKYGGVDYPMIGGAAMVGVAEREGYVTPEMAEPGDVVLMTKGPAVETAGILSTMFPEVIEKYYGRGFVERAQSIFWLQSVVEDALTLAELGPRKGVTAMHDATEYGVWGALNDLAEASGAAIRVYEDKLFMLEDVGKVVEAFSRFTGIEVDPYAAISEGTLIATVRRDYAGKAVELLEKKGIRASAIGEVLQGSGVTIVRSNGSEETIEQPRQDPFWPVFFKTLEEVRRVRG
ncbi:MAG: AIR synthase family protein [Desulfurococcales archaeon]|nr:AIR synthase family protein [Desulfurococcales archaeon]